VFEYRVLRLMWDVVTGKWWKLHNEELSGTYVHQILLGY